MVSRSAPKRRRRGGSDFAGDIGSAAGKADADVAERQVLDRMPRQSGDAAPCGVGAAGLDEQAERGAPQDQP